MNEWPNVPLGQVAKSVERSEAPLPGKVYRQLGVRLWGKGAYERETVDGAQTKYQTLSRVESGDIVVNKIWARSGSVAVVQPELAGCYVSGEFPTFVSLSEKLLPQWFHWFTKTRSLWQQCDEQSRGTSGKNRIRPEAFLGIQIPLPPLDEQQHIVARIEELAAKIEQARGLRTDTMRGVDTLLYSTLRSLFSEMSSEPVMPFVDVCSTIIDNLHSNPVYSETGVVACVRSSDVGWGKLSLENAAKTSEEEYRRRTVRSEPQPGDIVLVREGGGTGKAAVVEQGQRFSLGQRVMMIRVNESKAVPKFVMYQILAPCVYEDQIVALLKGSASPHLNIASLKQFRFIVPTLEAQHSIVDYLDHLQTKINALKRLQTETSAELDALLPAVLDKAFKGEL
jgi:type I restriction enzyme S subunit